MNEQHKTNMSGIDSMRKALPLLMICCSLHAALAQENDGVTDQIKKEREVQLEGLNRQLELTEGEMVKIREEMASLADRNIEGRIQKLGELVDKQDHRLAILENKRKTFISLNGQLAFAELLSLQRDVKPARLFSASQRFFNALGNVSNLQNYDEFRSWKTEYDAWYAAKGKEEKRFDFINQGVKLISNTASNVPLYGTVVNTVASGLFSLIGGIGKDGKKLAEKTPSMLFLLNAVSQFESQRADINNEWKSINEELDALQKENAALMEDQIEFYGLKRSDCQGYLAATTERERDEYKHRIRQTIEAKMIELGDSQAASKSWMLHVEKYMYRVQSIRIRFGQLTTRMLINIRRYRELIDLFSDREKFPTATAKFTEKVVELGGLLVEVEKTFGEFFNPSRYIEDSAVMYIEE